eukprot:TRINITY_DN5201_c0_g3_i1.p1 TRINITY_DN5201_c0_g3~~TRINITY_DN5201_c0_g3_i1.p1  ORF type:complete len:488 (+),score=175.68 TRINITY_DN5201_c0_g3_i1:103-1464(+)
MADSLRAWMVENGGELHPSVIAREMPEMGGGMGLCTDSGAGEGELLASVPLNLMFTTRVAKQHPAFQHYYDEQVLVPLQILPLFLSHEVRDEESYWYPWVSRLPKHYDTLIECSDDELQLLCVCPRRYRKVAHEKAEVRRLYDEAMMVLRGKKIPVSLPAAQQARLEALREIPFEEFRTNYCSVMSRGFYYNINASRHDVWTLIPWLDYFNYTDGKGHHAGFNDKTQRFEITTAHSVTENSQILLHYGTYSNFELLLWYGFVLHSNRNLRYKLSPPADANGRTPTDNAEWLMEIFDSLVAHFDVIPWASQKTIDMWKRDGIRALQKRGLDQNWTIAPPKGAHRGVKTTEETPPRVSPDLREAMKVLVKLADTSTAIDKPLVPAQLLKAIVVAEVRSHWKAFESFEGASYTSQCIGFMLNEEHVLLEHLSKLPDETFYAAFDNDTGSNGSDRSA